MFGLNLSVIAGLSLATAIALGWGAYGAYSYGYEVAELRCNSRVQAIKDEVAERNAKIRDEAARRRAEVDRILERQSTAAGAAAKREAEWRRRIEAYEANLRTRGDSCPLTEEDVRQLR